eukprot:364250-Chlamydomonas_euryale.AAC.5
MEVTGKDGKSHLRNTAARRPPESLAPPQEKQSWPIVKVVQEGNQPSPKGRIREAENSRRTKSHPAAVKNTMTDGPRGAGTKKRQHPAPPASARTNGKQRWDPVLSDSRRAKEGKEAAARPVGVTAGGLLASLGTAPAASHGRRAQRPLARHATQPQRAPTPLVHKQSKAWLGL